MNKLKKGFTLIELLAVIVILAVIALITVPIILGVIDDAKEKSFKESLRFIIDATNNFVAFNPDDSIPKEGIPVMDERIKMNNKSFKTGMAFINKDDEVELDFVSNGEYCGAGTKNNIIIVKGSCNKLDKTAPVINSVNALAKSSSEIEVTVSALDPESGIKEYYYSLNNGNYVKVNSNKFSIKNLDSNKEYKIKVKVLNGNNLETISEEVSVKTVELVIPTFTLDKEGWQKQRKVTINYNKGDILKYSYSLDNGNTWIEVTNNPVITLTENKVIIAKISDGTNHLTSTYQETQIDNTAPTITVNEITLFQNMTYDLKKYATCMDNENSCTVTTEGTLDLSTVGTYTITFKGTDEAGNIVTTTKSIKVMSSMFTFNYTGNSQTFVTPTNGTYKIELWGGSAGGSGAYVSGEIKLTKDTNLYVYVGSSGVGCNIYTDCGVVFNGGGSGGWWDAWNAKMRAMSGGGATDVRLVSGAWNDVTGLRSRIIVAGGAGTSSAGALNGIPGANAPQGYPGGGGGSQIAGGSSSISSGQFGVGGNGYIDALTICNCNDAWGGGGGYYGGGGGRAGSYNDCVNDSRGRAGGGSSYISGHKGSIAIKSSTDQTPKVPTYSKIEDSYHYSNKIFTNTNMKSGDESMPTYDSKTTMVGNKGNGYAKITIIGVD